MSTASLLSSFSTLPLPPATLANLEQLGYTGMTPIQAAALPLALASGAGAESRHQIGWVIVGGMLVGTLFTLFVVPTAYTLLAARHRTFEDRLAEDRAGTGAREHAAAE